jgi:hypothetical protein
MDLRHYWLPISNCPCPVWSIWERLQGLQLAQEQEDKFIWKWSSNQQYSASSAYKTFFLGQLPVRLQRHQLHTRRRINPSPHVVLCL